MKKLVVALMIVLKLSVVASASPVDFESKADKYYEKYKAEWEIMSDKYKNNIITSYAKGKIYNLGLTAAAIDFLESRGGIYLVNINQTNNMDCGRYGSNTKSHHYYIGKKDTKVAMIKTCNRLIEDEDLSFAHMLRTLNIAGERYAKYSGVTKWRKQMNYYNTGRDKYIGDYYIQASAVVRLLKEVLPLDQIKLVKIDGKYKGIVEDEMLLAMAE